MNALKEKLKNPAVVGALIFLLALLIRLPGLHWGLPDSQRHWSLHPDEPVIWAYSQQIKPAEGKFTPGFYNYGTLYLTLLRVSTDVVNGYGGAPQAKDGSDVPDAMARYHLAGRIISLISGAALAWTVLAILWRRTHWVGALAGALAVAAAPALVIHSDFQTVDMLATFLLVAGALWALRLVPEGDDPPPPKAALWSGVLIGLSAGTKYTGVLGLLVLAVACAWTRRWKDLAVGSVACLVTFLVTTPGMFLDGEKFWKDFGYEMAHSQQGHGLVFAGTSIGFVYHLASLALGFGTISLLLGLVGLGAGAIKKQPWLIAVGVFFLAYFLLIGRAEVKFIRYTFPLVPVLALGLGWLVGEQHKKGTIGSRGVVTVAILGLGGLLGGGLASSLQAAQDMSRPDPRRECLAVFDTQKGFGPGTVGLVSDPWFYTPELYADVGQPRWVPFPQRDAEMRAAHPIPNTVLRYVPENPDERKDWDTRLLDEKPRFVAFSSFETEGLERLTRSSSVPDEYRDQVDRYREFAKRLQAEYDPVFDQSRLSNPWLQVHDLMYIRPNIWVWIRKDASRNPSTGSSTTSGSNGAPANTP
ncbi:MAG: DUF2029 domain-containing protein [Armatimonadetes bacterium]|nr:DUF2029 domain-containing protein [Armatimonadota bacterium]